MKVQRARLRIISLIVLCAFAFVIVLSLRVIGDLPEDADLPDAGDLATNEEYVEEVQPSFPPDSSTEETAPPAESPDTFGL